MEHGVLKALHEERKHFRTEPWGLVTMDRNGPAPTRTINPPEIQNPVEVGTSGGGEGNRETEQTAPAKEGETTREGEGTPDENRRPEEPRYEAGLRISALQIWVVRQPRHRAQLRRTSSY